MDQWLWGGASILFGAHKYIYLYGMKIVTFKLLGHRINTDQIGSLKNRFGKGT